METKSKLTVKSILKLICFILLLTFFIPSCLVSCSGVEIKVSGFNAMTGVTVDTGFAGKEQVSEFNFGAMLMLLVPLALLFLLFTNKQMQERVKAIACTVLYGLDIALWAGFAAEIMKVAEEEGSGLFEVDFTGWYWINLLLPVAGTIMCLLVIFNIFHFDTAFGQGMLITNPVNNDTTPPKSNEAPEGVSSTETSPQPNVNLNPAMDKAKMAINSLAEKFKVLPKKTLAIVGCGALALILALCLISDALGTVNINKYLTFEEVGYDGYGRVRISFDYDKFISDNGSKIKLTSAGKKRLMAEGYDLEDIAYLTTNIGEYFLDNFYAYPDNDKNGKLSNGDTIRYTIEADEDYLQNFDIKYKIKDGEYKVSNLEAIATKDLFEDIELSCYGMSGEGNCSPVGENNYYILMETKSSTLSNGDVVVLKVDETKLDDIAKQLGAKPAEMTKEFTVSGLTERLTNIEQISDYSLNRLEEIAKNDFYDYVNSRWSKDTEELKDIETLGQLIYSRKGKDSKLYYIFEVTVANTYKEYEKDFTYYWYYQFTEPTLEDGEVTWYTTYTPSNTVYNRPEDVSYSWHYSGYETLESLLKNIKMEGYDLSDNIH